MQGDGCGGSDGSGHGRLAGLLVSLDLDKQEE